MTTVQDFSFGRRVRCVDAEGTNAKLVQGREYTVRYATESKAPGHPTGIDVYLQEAWSGLGWNSNRFEPSSTQKLFRVRTVKPQESRWYEVWGETPEEAANDFHVKNMEALANLSWKVEQKRSAFKRLPADFDGSGQPSGSYYFLKFVCVEVEGHGEMVSRMYHHGLWRRGGVKGPDHFKSREQKLKELAEALGWSHDPEELISDEGWDGDEGPHDP